MPDFPLDNILVFLAVVISTLLVLFVVRKHTYSLFIVVLLTTEFFYITVFGGFSHPYHFFAVAIVLLLARHVRLLFRSKVFWGLIVFVAINLVAISFSDFPAMAAASILSLGANIAVALATAFILFSGRMSIASMKRVVLVITIVNIFWGLTQIIGFRLGQVLALSPTQEMQILIGFGPGFRNEANGFGKYMIVPFLLYLPELIKLHVSNRISWIYMLFVVGIFMNFTRTSVYGLMATCLFLFLWYLKKGDLFLLFRKQLRLSLIAAGLFAVIVSGAFGISDYALYKINNLFKEQEILEGESSSYRMEGMKLVVDQASSNTRKLIIGNGWGQTRVIVRGVEVQAGGGDLVNVLGFSGLIGIAGYLGYSLLSVNAARKAADSGEDMEKSRFAEGTMFALIGVFITSQMAGFIINPEYWMLIGFSIFLDVRPRKPLPGQRRSR